MTKAELIEEIVSYVYTNGRGEITGANLQDVLVDMVNILGAAAFLGVGSVQDGDTGVVTGDAVYDALTTALSNYVPTSRKVNNHALTADITLTLDDIGDGVNRVLNNYFTEADGVVRLKNNYSYFKPRLGLIFDVNSVQNTPAELMKVNVGTEANPVYALKSTLPFFSESWISAGGVSSGGGQAAGNASMQLITGGGRITNGTDTLDVYSMSNTYTKQEVNSLIGSISGFKYEIYASLGDITHPSASVLYLIGPTGSGADKYEEYVYSNSTFVKIGDTSIDLSGYATQTWVGNNYQPLDADLTAIAGLSGTSGLLKKTAANTWTLDTNTYLTSHQTIYALTIKNSGGTTELTYTPNSGAGSITLTKGMVGLGNVENTALSTWAGSSNITTLGTISTGTWHGSAIANAYLANSSITIGSTAVSLGGSITNLAGIGTISMSGALTISTTKKIYFGDTNHYVELDSNGYFHFSHGLYSDSFVSAGGVSSGGGTSGIDLAAMWASLQNNDIGTSGPAYEHRNDKIHTWHLPALTANNGLTASYGSTTSGSGLADTLTIGVGSSYKLPLVTEWNSKADASALNDYLPLSAGSSYPLSGDLYLGSNNILNAGYISAAGYYQLNELSLGRHINATGWYRVWTCDVEPGSIILNVGRTFNTDNNESYCFAVSWSYSGEDVMITQLSGVFAIHEIDYIRFVSTSGGRKAIDVHYTSNANQELHVSGYGCGVFQEPTLTTDDSGVVTSLQTTSGFATTRKLVSSATSGEPLSVASTTKVDNLNADYLDGQHGTYYAAASSLSNYLPLSGGTSYPITNYLTLRSWLYWQDSQENGLGSLMPDNNHVLWWYDMTNWREVIHSGNWSSYINNTSLGAYPSSNPSNFVDASGAVSACSGTYVKLSATASQTIAASVSDPLFINSTNTDSTQVCVILRKSGVDRIQLGYTAGYGTWLYDYTNQVYIGIDSTGKPTFNGNVIYHAGNANRSNATWEASSLTLHGAASGVTNIDSLLYFDTIYSRVGIGNSSPGSTLDVNGLTTTKSMQMKTNSLYVSSPSWRRVFHGNGYHGTAIIFIYGSYNNTNPVSLALSVNVGYNRASITKLSGCSAGVNEFPKARVIFESAGSWYVDIYYSLYANNQLNTSSIGDGYSIAFEAETLPESSYTHFDLDLVTDGMSVLGVIHSTTGIYSDGYVSAGGLSTSSDARLKDNIKDFSYNTALLMAIKPREWDWNGNTPMKGHAAGFVAQEIENLLPYAVTERTYKQLTYDTFHAVEIAGLQDHETRIQQLERESREKDAKIAELENTIARLTN